MLVCWWRGADIPMRMGPTHTQSAPCRPSWRGGGRRKDGLVLAYLLANFLVCVRVMSAGRGMVLNAAW